MTSYLHQVQLAIFVKIAHAHRISAVAGDKEPGGLGADGIALSISNGKIEVAVTIEVSLGDRHGISVNRKCPWDVEWCEVDAAHYATESQKSDQQEPHPASDYYTISLPVAIVKGLGGSRGQSLIHEMGMAVKPSKRARSSTGGV